MFLHATHYFHISPNGVVSPTGYRLLGIVYLDQLQGARQTHTSYHDIYLIQLLRNTTQTILQYKNIFPKQNNLIWTKINLNVRHLSLIWILDTVCYSDPMCLRYFIDFVHLCNGIGVLAMNRTTSMPMSVLRYDVDKDLTSIWYSVFAKSCFPNEIQLYLILFDVGNIS